MCPKCGQLHELLAYDMRQYYNISPQKDTECTEKDTACLQKSSERVKKPLTINI